VHCETSFVALWLALFTFVPRALYSEQGGLPVIAPGSQGSLPGIDQSRPYPGQRPEPEDEVRARAEKEMAKRANQDRQAQLKRDTEHLLKLATELQEYVGKSNENILSLSVVKKAEEIEKLAHSVKEKMKGP
jgi:hypothetical protein